MQFYDEPMHSIHLRGETISSPATWFGIITYGLTNRVTVMNSRINDASEQIDHRTCRSICNAVGERLQQDIRPVNSELPSHLQHLMDELRRLDINGRRMASN
jgi:hypothetical protein